jgi:TolB-like protein/predicted Zn-dependent protease
MDEPGKTGESGRLEGLVGPGAGPKRPVFISYASHDAAIAQKVCSALETARFSCWIAPRDVVPGTLYAEGIVRALDESRVLVLVLSKDAVASAHVGKELERATSKRHPIIALKVDSAPLTPAFEYFLNESQWIEAGVGGTESEIAKLVEAVERHLAPGAAAAGSQTPRASVRKSVLSRRGWWIAAAAVVVLALVGAYFLAGKAWLHSNTAAVPVADKSIAVLPFVDMSEKKDQEYFADGMAEEIIDLLVKIPGIKVIGRTSSFAFKGKTEDLRSIGQQLGVAYVLEGSVRKSGDRLRVTAQLINAQDGTHLLSQTYDRDLSDVLKMQDEIAIKVVRALQVEVSSTYMVSRPALRNKEAYALFLRGAHAADRYEPQGWEQARSDFQRALELDPTFAEAAGSFAGTSEFGGLVGYMPSAVAFEESRHYAELAIKLDPNLAWAYGILSDIHNAYDWDWAAADREITQALALAPNSPDVLASAAVHSLTMGRVEEALKQISAATELNPLEPSNYFWLNSVQLRRGRFPEAEAAIRRTLEISPTYTFAQFQLGLTLLARVQSDAALTEFLKEPAEGGRLNGSAIAYFALGRKADSDSALAKSINRKTIRFSSGIAAVYACRGEIDEAFKWLERAYSERDPILYRIKYSREYDNLHEDPRYKAFLKKMNLPEG